MSENSTKKLLIVGATGRQGRSLVRHLRPAEDGEQIPDHTRLPFHVLALTRKRNSPNAKMLSKEPHVTLVQGDLNDPASIRKIFEDEKESGGIWGVFVALAFPGLGANADAEEMHGKFLADLAVEYGVKCFIFSSVERGGEEKDDDAVLDRLAKVRIERHVRSLGDKGLPWVILRPGFFMENFEGTLGSLTVGILKAGLQPTTSILLVALDDIGGVATGVFRDHTSFTHQILVVGSEALTMEEQEEAYRNATGRSRPSVPSLVARGLVSMNSFTQGVITEMERAYLLHKDSAVNNARVEAARRAMPLMTSFHSWCAQHYGKSSQREKGWNHLSVAKLITGKH
ncbi:NAD(P)-binding protein [Pluteus cervinus]|uniref:NAD(P)-binding protein n=1 Tax=Pluteus cervinus TaxID=181527 RepID=A0ACD3A7H8_9AGAR|nr:NAD(P)-binding protein [Pluteus cervinus]